MNNINLAELKNTADHCLQQAQSVVIPFRYRLMYWIYYILLAYTGKQIHSPTLDCQYEDSLVWRGYVKYCRLINEWLCKTAPTGGGDISIPTYTLDEIDLDGLRLLMKANVPFLIRGGAAHLPANKWTLEYLNKAAGSCEVPVNKAADKPSNNHNLPTKASNYYDFHRGTLSEVVQSIQNGGNMRLTTAEDVMHHDNGRLRKDLCVSFFEEITDWAASKRHWLRSRLFAGKVVSTQLIVQPENAFTLWHTEPGDNFFILIKGIKTWTIAHPYYTALMQPRVKKTTNYHGSNIDIRESLDVLKQRGFDGYTRIPSIRFDVHPGDILRVPNFWWHTVETHPGQYTIAATVRATCMPNLTCPGYLGMRMLDGQYHAMARSFLRYGKIFDKDVGVPRRSRSNASDGTAEQQT